jgi:hypothetical protein
VKKSIISLCCLLLVLVVSSCTLQLQNDATDKADPDEEATEDTVEDPFADPTTDPDVTTEAPATTAEVTDATDAAPVNTATMYSSYAEIVTYDPSTGWAEFDYFDMLKGDAAVDWLVNQEGYTLADAQNEVDNYADSEFVYKNVNPQLRTVDLSVTPLKMMYYPDGSPMPGADPVDTTFADFNTLYTAQPDLVMDSFFFHVTVTGGVVVSVEQVYWP